MSGHGAENDAHAGCHEAWERQLRRAQFAEARLEALVSDLRQLAHEFDGIEGHRTHAALGGKTLGGAIRNLVNGEAVPRPIPPGSCGICSGPLDKVGTPRCYEAHGVIPPAEPRGEAS